MKLFTPFSIPKADMKALPKRKNKSSRRETTLGKKNKID
tara:strand:- start:392 stop:508 length:117 start_codon:yes stop_codon:yes gene_type:complete